MLLHQEYCEELRWSPLCSHLVLLRAIPATTRAHQWRRGQEGTLPQAPSSLELPCEQIMGSGFFPDLSSQLSWGNSTAATPAAPLQGGKDGGKLSSYQKRNGLFWLVVVFRKQCWELKWNWKAPIFSGRRICWKTGGWLNISILLLGQIVFSHLTLKQCCQL